MPSLFRFLSAPALIGCYFGLLLVPLTAVRAALEMPAKGAASSQPAKQWEQADSLPAGVAVSLIIEYK